MKYLGGMILKKIIGFIGFGVMGKSMVLYIFNDGYFVLVYIWIKEKVDSIL